MHKTYTKNERNDKMKLLFFDKEELCTEIIVDKEQHTISVINHTEDIMKRAFGNKMAVSWEDLEMFLESRCFERNRLDKTILLKDIGLKTYDVWEIIKKTKGKKEEDNQWIEWIA